MSIYRTSRCPSCGHTWERKGPRGRPRSQYYRAEGKTMHAEDWAIELGVSIETLRRNRIKYGGDFDLVVKLLRKPTEREYQTDANRPIVTAGNKGWRPKP